MSFEKTVIPFEATGQFSKVFTDYIKGEKHLAPFYTYEPSVAGFKKAIEDRKNVNTERSVLVKALKENYGENITEATRKNIELLSEKTTFTVTTGHQLCLFTGPLYFIYKIITVINLAEKLKQEYPQNDFVPVYWMASEDHDFAEINHTYLYGKKVEWSGDSLSGGPVGRIPVETLQPVLDGLFAIMGESSNAGELKKIIADSYSNTKTLSRATFDFVNALFGKYGLVIAEPDSVELKKIFLPVITDELKNQSSCKCVGQTDAKLAELGIEPQIHAREINLFYVNSNGRNRIEKQGDKYSVIGTSVLFTREQILAEAQQYPDRFSPNVVLRPVYQQMILPNIAYIGGPAEVAYWLQLKAVLDYHKALFPLLMPRNFGMIIDNGTAAKMGKLKLNAHNIFNDTEDLIKGFVTGDAGVDFEPEKEKLKSVYDTISQKIKTIDSTLAASAEAELQKQYNALKVIETKLMRAQKQKDEASVNQIRKIKEKLFPENSLQERHDNFIPFYLQYGGAFFDIIKKEFDPFKYCMSVLSEQ